MPIGYIVDVMENVRKVLTSSISIFGDLCQNFSEMVFLMCKNAKRIDFVFDCYFEGSVKDKEIQGICQRFQLFSVTLHGTLAYQKT